MANTIHSYHREYWARRMSILLWGYNIDGKTNKVEEYARYNAWRRAKYDQEDAEYRVVMHRIAFCFALLLVAFIAVI